MNGKSSLIYLFFLLLSCQLGAQGPIDGYLKSPGEVDLALGLSATGADLFLDADGESRELPFRATLLGAFAAIGVAKGFNVVASVPFVITNDQSGLQDGALFAKGRVLKLPFGKSQDKNLDVLAALGIQAPLSKYEVVANGAIGQRAKLIQPKLVLQYNQSGFFASTIVGYNYRFDELDVAQLQMIQRLRPAYQPQQPKDQVTGLFRVGIPTSSIYADVWLEIQRTLGGSDAVADVNELPQAYDVDYQQIGGTFYYSEGSTWGFAASGATVVGGRNTSKFWRLSGTLIYKFGGKEM